MYGPAEKQGSEEAHHAADAAVAGLEPEDNVIKPSTEKEPGEETKAAPDQGSAEQLSHEAVGIGVLEDSQRTKETDE